MNSETTLLLSHSTPTASLIVPARFFSDTPKTTFDFLEDFGKFNSRNDLRSSLQIPMFNLFYSSYNLYNIIKIILKYFLLSIFLFLSFFF